MKLGLSLTFAITLVQVYESRSPPERREGRGNRATPRSGQADELASQLGIRRNRRKQKEQQKHKNPGTTGIYLFFCYNSLRSFPPPKIPLKGSPSDFTKCLSAVSRGLRLFLYIL